MSKDDNKIAVMQSALFIALDTLSNIADEGIDMDTFNEGGVGYEAIQIINAALDHGNRQLLNPSNQAEQKEMTKEQDKLWEELAETLSKPFTHEELMQDGGRCPEFSPGCAVCKAWAAYDLRAAYEAGRFGKHPEIERVLQHMAFDNENDRQLFDQYNNGETK